jgi:hypothetical protein
VHSGGVIEESIQDKGIIASIPNQQILASTLGMQEAKDSSAIENIVTTHDELFRHGADPDRVGNNAGFRRVPGTTLKDGSGHVVYTPPQS